MRRLYMVGTWELQTQITDILANPGQGAEATGLWLRWSDYWTAKSARVPDSDVANGKGSHSAKGTGKMKMHTRMALLAQ
jgi:hypothetical protein